MTHSEGVQPGARVAPSPPKAAVALRLDGDIEDWLIRLEVYTPFEQERLDELDAWRDKTAAEYASVFRSLVSVLPALPKEYRSKPSLVRRFPRGRSTRTTRATSSQ
jgi:hypothetical protein